ncbi:hypothetical protein CO709_04250 [Burkholderia thailandensis]|nr:hypothetical protein CO709_04250 [Burkholderia thailandensis]
MGYEPARRIARSAAAGRLLSALGFSSQKPERRAIERNEEAVLSWKRKTWPALKKSAPPSDD